MELRINDYQLPEQITFNYEELKQELALQMIIVFAVMVVYGMALASKDMKNNRGDISRS